MTKFNSSDYDNTITNFLNNELKSGNLIPIKGYDLFGVTQFEYGKWKLEFYYKPPIKWGYITLYKLSYNGKKYRIGEWLDLIEVIYFHKTR